MMLFRLFLIACFSVILIYTLPVGMEHGWGLFSVFFGDIAARNWPGQFNLDFLTMLLLSGSWTAWRNEFRPAGLALAAVAVLGGMMFLSLYLLWLSVRYNGDMRVMLLGETRAAS